MTPATRTKTTGPSSGAKPPQRAKVALKGKEQNDDSQGEEQSDRALGENRETRRQPEERSGSPAVRIARSPSIKRRQGHPNEKAQQRVDLGPTRLVPEHIAGRQKYAGECSRLRTEPTPAQTHDQNEGPKSSDHRRQPSGELGDGAQRQREDGDQPEKQRWLVAVDDPVDMGHQPLAVGHHLAGALTEEGFVRRPQIVGTEKPQEDHCGQHEDQALVLHVDNRQSERWISIMMTMLGEV